MLIPKIKEHMIVMPYVDSRKRTYAYGEFFPPEFSPHAYNESTAQEFFPLTKETAQEKGFAWKEAEENSYVPTIRWNELPDSITGISEDILNQNNDLIYIYRLRMAIAHVKGQPKILPHFPQSYWHVL